MIMAQSEGSTGILRDSLSLFVCESVSLGMGKYHAFLSRSKYNYLA